MSELFLHKLKIPLFSVKTMLSDKQILEIREHLEKAQNPVFFFDNDQDGLCSFLLLKRFLEKGKGVPIRSFPSLDKDYFRKVSEFNSDYVFILDKPVVSEQFFEEVEKLNLPIVWIDHHEIPELKIPEFVNYYNPLFSGDKSNEPITNICYRITKRKEDLWLAVAGCVADKFIPDFYNDFKKTFPDLCVKEKVEDAFKILYDSQIGKISRMFGFGLKDRTTNVIHTLKFLIKAKSPYDVIEESKENKVLHDRFNYLFPKYEKLLKKAVSLVSESKLLFFQYGGDLSISSDLANELIYLFPKKIIVVAYVSGAKINLSVRGKNIREKVLKSLEGLNNAHGGGHEDAVGANVRVEDLELFRKNLTGLIG